MNIIGVLTFSIYVIGDRAAKSARSWNGVPRNHIGWNIVKSAEYHHAAQSDISRCDTAALKRSVCVTTQLVSNPPPLPPVTPSLFGSTHPRLITSSTPAIKSL